MAIEKVGLELSYQSNLDGLARDRKRIKEHADKLLKDPILIPVRLDLRDLKTQLHNVSGEIKKGLSAAAAAAGSGILGPDGRAATPDREPAEPSQFSRTVTKTTFNKKGEPSTQTVRNVERVGEGIQRITELRGKKGKPPKLVSITRDDQSALASFRREIDSISKSFSKPLGDAKGLRDTARQIKLLEDQAKQLRAVLNDTRFTNIVDDKEFRRAEQKITQLQDRAATLGGARDRGRKTQQAERIIKNAERRQQALLDTNDRQIEAAKAVENKQAREQALNNLYKERVRILERHRDLFRRIDLAAQNIGRDDIADRGFRRAHVVQNQLNKLEKDRSKAASRGARKDTEASLRAELQQVKALEKAELGRSRNAETQARSIRNRRLREEQLNKVLASRVGIYSKVQRQLAQIEARAAAAGFQSASLQARGARNNSLARAASDFERVERSASKSGHAINFHTSSMLRNAGTFLKWYGPMQLVLSGLQAIGSAADQAVRIDRQFATLTAVFRGTRQEAARLTDETLELAVANGRSSEEAVDAAIRFSRLGLTRVQTLRAVESALIAANVAETSAAETAEKLSALYATFNLTVADLPAIVNRVNAITNRYNVTNDALYDGIVRVAGVAKQAGIELRELESIIASAAGASGRPAAELGNALKFIIQRSRRPETAKKLETQFGFDLTGPTGEFKDYTRILQELSTLYTSLGRNQQAALLDIVAGARQSARAVLFLEQVRQSQILAAQASFDTSSAFDENRKITASLESQLQSLETAWGSLASTFAETGAFDALGGFILNLRDNLGLLKDDFTAVRDLFRDSSDLEAPRGTPDRTGLRSLRRTATNLPGFQLFGRRGFTEEELREREAELQRAKESSRLRLAAGSILQAANEALFKPLTGRAPDVSKIGDANRFLADAITPDQILEKEISSLNRAAEQVAAQSAASAIEDIGTQTNKLRSELEGLQSGENVFQGLAEDARSGNVTTQVLVRNFRQASELLTNLEDGPRVFAENFSEVMALLRNSDTESAATRFEQLGELFGRELPSKTEKFRASQHKTIDEVEANIEKILQSREQVIAALAETEQGTPAFQKQKEALKQITDELQNAEDQLRKIQETFDSDILKGLTPKETGRIKTFFADLSAQAEALGSTIENLSVSGGAESIERAIRQKSEAVELQLALFEEVVANTTERAQQRIAELRLQADRARTAQESPFDPDEVERDIRRTIAPQIRAQENFLALAEQQTSLQRAETNEELRKARATQRALSLQKALYESVRELENLPAQDERTTSARNRALAEEETLSQRLTALDVRRAELAAGANDLTRQQTEELRQQIAIERARLGLSPEPVSETETRRTDTSDTHSLTRKAERILRRRQENTIETRRDDDPVADQSALLSQLADIDAQRADLARQISDEMRDQNAEARARIGLVPKSSRNLPAARPGSTTTDTQVTKRITRNREENVISTRREETPLDNQATLLSQLADFDQRRANLARQLTDEQRVQKAEARTRIGLVSTTPRDRRQPSRPGTTTTDTQVTERITRNREENIISTRREGDPLENQATLLTQLADLDQRRADLASRITEEMRAQNTEARATLAITREPQQTTDTTRGIPRDTTTPPASQPAPEPQPRPGRLESFGQNLRDFYDRTQQQVDDLYAATNTVIANAFTGTRQTASDLFAFLPGRRQEQPRPESPVIDTTAQRQRIESAPLPERIDRRRAEEPGQSSFALEPDELPPVRFNLEADIRNLNQIIDLEKKRSDIASTQRETQEIDNEIRNQESLIQIAERQRNIKREEAETELRKIEIQERALAIQQEFEKSAKRSTASSRAFLIGETDSEQRINQSRALIERISTTTTRSEQETRDGGSLAPREAASRRGQILQDEATLLSNLESLEERRYDLMAQAANLARQHTDELRKQTEEARRRLGLASRDDQLNAALLNQAVTERGKPLSNDEFQFLSEENRQIVSDYLPDARGGGENPVDRQFSERRQKLAQEFELLGQALGPLRAAIVQAESDITASIGSEGSLAIQPEVREELQQVAQHPEDQPFNIDVGGINLDIRISEQIGAISDTIQAQVSARLDAELADIRSTFARPLSPNNAPARSALE